MTDGEQISPMSTALDAEVKTRVPEKTRAALERIADSREISVSDVVREALRAYVPQQVKKLDKKEVSA